MIKEIIEDARAEAIEAVLFQLIRRLIAVGALPREDAEIMFDSAAEVGSSELVTFLVEVMTSDCLGPAVGPDEDIDRSDAVGAQHERFQSRHDTVLRLARRLAMEELRRQSGAPDPAGRRE